MTCPPPEEVIAMALSVAALIVGYGDDVRARSPGDNEAVPLTDIHDGDPQPLLASNRDRRRFGPQVGDSTVSARQ